MYSVLGMPKLGVWLILSALEAQNAVSEVRIRGCVPLVEEIIFRKRCFALGQINAKSFTSPSFRIIRLVLFAAGGHEVDLDFGRFPTPGRPGNARCLVERCLSGRAVEHDT